VTPGYFQTIRAKLIKGRYFSEGEASSKRAVVVVNRAFAKKYFPEEDPIGKQIGNTQLTPDSLKEIIGVVEDIRDGSLASEIWPAQYIPFDQDSDTYFSLVVRTREYAASMLQTIVSAVHASNPDLGILDEVTMEDRMRQSQAAYIHRSAAWLMSGFAAIALVLGIVGFYGVVGHSVTQRTREIGVRMALGAAPQTVRRMVLGEVAQLVLLAGLFGIAGFITAAALMRGMFYRVSQWDLPTLAAVSLVLCLAALIACYLPARRAASVDPVEALRAE